MGKDVNDLGRADFVLIRERGTVWRRGLLIKVLNSYDRRRVLRLRLKLGRRPPQAGVRRVRLIGALAAVGGGAIVWALRLAISIDWEMIGHALSTP